MSPRCAQKLARLQTIVAQRAAWASPLAQVTRMHGWVLSVEHLLDGNWAQEGEVVSMRRWEAAWMAGASTWPNS